MFPREVCEADELVRVLDVDGEDERVRAEICEVVEGLDEGRAVDVRVEFDEELDDLVGAREADTVLVEEKVGADVGCVCDFGIEDGKVTDACVQSSVRVSERDQMVGIKWGKRSGPGRTRFLRVLAAVPLPFMTRTWACSRALWPAAAQRRSWRSYFCW